MQSALAADRHSSDAPSRVQTTFSILMITSCPNLWASDSTAGRRQETKLKLL